jgi:hypothetical protein
MIAATATPIISVVTKGRFIANQVLCTAAPG